MCRGSVKENTLQNSQHGAAWSAEFPNTLNKDRRSQKSRYDGFFLHPSIHAPSTEIEPFVFFYKGLHFDFTGLDSKVLFSFKHHALIICSNSYMINQVNMAFKSVIKCTWKSFQSPTYQDSLLATSQVSNLISI